MQILYVHMQDKNVDIRLICLFMQGAYYSYVDMRLFNVKHAKKLHVDITTCATSHMPCPLFELKWISCMSTKISKHIDINKSHFNVNFILHVDMFLSHVIIIKHADVDKCHVNKIMTFGKQWFIYNGMSTCISQVGLIILHLALQCMSNTNFTKWKLKTDFRQILVTCMLT